MLSSVATLASEVAPPPPLAFGINAHVPDHVKALDQAAFLGVDYVRVELPWFEIERVQDRYELARTRAAFALAAGYGVKILALLSKTPQWISAADGVDLPKDRAHAYPLPHHVGEWRQFVSDMVRWSESEFPGLVIGWELWNEPHSRTFWTGSAADYRDRILIPGYDAVKVVDPGALVLGLGGYGYRVQAECSPALPCGGPWEGGGELDDVLRGAGAAHLDALSLHYYYEDRGGDNPAEDMRRYLENLARWLRARELGAKAVWLTETGASSYLVGTQGQAERLASFMEDVFLSPDNQAFGGSRYRLDSVAYYDLSENTHGAAEPNPIYRHHGLFLDPEHDLRPCRLAPKPAANALAEIINAARGRYAARLRLDTGGEPATGAGTAVVVATNTGTEAWRASSAGEVVEVAIRNATACTLGPRGCELLPGAIALVQRAIIATTVAPGESVALPVELAAPPETAAGPRRHVVELQLGRHEPQVPDVCTAAGATSGVLWFGERLTLFLSAP
ncbi:MAG: hypothetical protein HYV63_02875 [Candidatus Schekmanbacteria bacterium]|nr:hypothetical protein [Candidatus Schekmanbacteria bacterium]